MSPLAGEKDRKDQEPIPFDEALRRMVQAPPKPVKKDEEKKEKPKE